ncbi:MAG: DUF5011 domain-containing protein [Candidatus Paceibacteria bacterium]
MKYSKMHKIIQNIGASFSAIVTGFLIGLFVYGSILTAPHILPKINVANAESLSVTCSVTKVSEITATWVATVTGGSGSVTYSWSGTDGLINSTATVTKTYTTSGTKNGTVTVTSGGSSASANCSINITVPASNTAPVITLIGATTTEISLGSTFTDPGATAADVEDGDITASIVTSSTVDTATVGTYTVTYNVSDSLGLAAAEVTRTVNVTDSTPTPPSPTPSPPSAPSGGSSGGGGGSSGGGGGGGTLIRLEISNEKVGKLATSTALVTWDTNLQANSQVFYDTASHTSSKLPFKEYRAETSRTDSLVTKHSVIISGLNLNIPYYFRPASFRSNEQKGGIELNLKPDETTGPAICSKYLFEPIKFGENNSVIEVLKLQVFLNDFEGFNLDATGVYDLSTFEAVEIFQERYSDDILKPWGIDGSTGYVYITTMKKINEIYCNKFISFDINDLEVDEQEEVNEFNVLLDSLRDQGLPLPDTSKVGMRGPIKTVPDISTSFEAIVETEDTQETVITVSDTTTNGKEFMASVVSATRAKEGKSEAIKEFFKDINIGNFLRVLLYTVF